MPQSVSTDLQPVARHSCAGITPIAACPQINCGLDQKAHF